MDALIQDIYTLISRFQHPDRAVRRDAVRSLKRVGAPAVPYLVEALRAESTPTRQHAAQALGQIADPLAVPPLLMALADEDSGVWSQAVAALAQIGARELLRSALSSSVTRVRWGASLALWRMRREEAAFPYLLLALQSDDLLVRNSAVLSLWQQPDDRALATLQIILTPEDSVINRYILQALQHIGTPGAQAAIAHWLSQQPRRRDA
ncbi:MAG: HEAT repeat domain-containing protein [Anaerolineae bacterium]|nr:HEAT repeat domain-containing protein [Anaerolineae bacterium]MDW8171691.1 HEAT repeat domain-containing protein [Anaerolineae bacterium]